MPRRKQVPRAAVKRLIILILLQLIKASPQSHITLEVSGMATLSIFILIALLGFASVTAADEKGEMLMSFVEGEYSIIGRMPDSGPVYSGKGSIRISGDGLIFTRQIGKRKTVIEGMIAVPMPPGEGRVIRFKWNDKGKKEMVCLVTGDLDNYARLTCYWGKAGYSHKQPGLEAMFPTAVWQDEPPKKQDKK